jgi:ERCC4-type nuclease
VPTGADADLVSIYRTGPFDAPDYHERRGHAETLNAAKAAAKRAADVHMLKTRKRRPDAEAIEAIAKDAEREARGLRTFDPAKAKALRAKARETRKQMFEGAKIKRRRR